jgi:hypothetical protein
VICRMSLGCWWSNGYKCILRRKLLLNYPGASPFDSQAVNHDAFARRLSGQVNKELSLWQNRACRAPGTIGTRQVFFAKKSTLL